MLNSTRAMQTIVAAINIYKIPSLCYQKFKKAIDRVQSRLVFR